MRRFLPAYLAVVLAGALALSGCAVTPATTANRILDLRMAYDAQHAAEAAYAARPKADPKVVTAWAQADAAALSAINGYAAAPADSLKAQAVAAAMSALTAIATQAAH